MHIVCLFVTQTKLQPSHIIDYSINPTKHYKCIKQHPCGRRSDFSVDD